MSAKKERPVRGGALPANPSQRDLAAFTGLSRRRMWQAKKVADIPEEEFERLVESDNPPTVTELLHVAQHRAGSAAVKGGSIEQGNLLDEVAIAICEADCGRITENELDRCRGLAKAAINVMARYKRGAL